MRFVRAAWAALSFLTRLVPPPPAVDERLLQASVVWFPLVGLPVGIACCLPLYWGLADGSPLLQAWVYLLVALWATRGLHWDGLADVADAWGSGQHGDRFYEILKDSRIGAFGVMALVMGLGGYTLLASRIVAEERWLTLLLAPVAGRIAIWLLAGICPKTHPTSSLGRIVSQAVNTSLLFGGCLLLLFVGYAGLGLKGCLFLMPGLTILLLFLRRIACREGGINGDFFGSAVVLTEMLFLAAGAWN